MTEGVYVVAYGDQARGCARELIRTVHQFTPGVPVCLASDSPLGGEDVLVQSERQDRGARRQKVRVWWDAPEDWERIVYLDADMMIRQSIEPLFEILRDGWDLVMTQGPSQCPLIVNGQRRRFPLENAYTRQVLGSDRYPQISGGAWGFQRNARTELYFETFWREWNRFKERDQQAMDRALYECPVSIWLLGREWNWFMHHERPHDGVTVMHFATAARDWVVRHPGRSLWLEWKGRL